MRLHPLTYLAEGDEVVVGRTDTDSYGLFPPDGAQLLRQLEAGVPVADAARWYERRYGEPVDIDGFVDTLRELDFIAGTGPAPAGPDPAGVAPRPVRWQRLGRALFGRTAWVLYGVLLATTVAVWVTHPHLLPRRDHVFFTHYLVVVEISLSLAQIPLVLLHEAFHLLAGRRLGLNSSVHISRRLYFLGFETKLDGLVVVPRRQRYLPMLAGMLVDLLGLCALTVVAWCTMRPDGSMPVVGGFCLALAFTAVPRIGWQFYFFLRTDLYHLVVTVLGCVDLHTTAREMMANRWWRLVGRPDRLVDPGRWHPADVRVARWYGPVFVAGYVVMFATLALITVPLAWRFFSTAVRTLASSSAPPDRFWDAAVLLALTAFQLVLSACLAVRDRRRKLAARVP